MTSTSTTFKHDDYVDLLHVFAVGDISRATKSELERYAVMLTRPNAHTQIGSVLYPQMCDAVRTLIVVRLSEESNREALRNSKIALGVSLVALLVALGQLVVDISK